jgi:hypothetical protein
MKSITVRKVFVVSGIAILLISSILIGGRWLIFNKIKGNLKERLAELREKGIHIEFESVRLKAWTGKLSVYNLVVHIDQDSVDQEIRLQLPLLTVTGIKLLPFITKNVLSIQSVAVHQPTIDYQVDFHLLEDNNRRESLENIEIGHFSLSDALLRIQSADGKDTLAVVYANIEIDQLGLERYMDSLVWKKAEIGIADVLIKFPRQKYTLYTSAIHIGLSRQEITIDSIRILPEGSASAYMKFRGEETDYIKGTINGIKARGINFYAYPQPALEIDFISSSFDLQVFRDKRYPFRKTKHTVLPSHFLQRLPLQLKIDTVAISSSSVYYDEFPEDGETSGRVYFTKLEATISDIHNIPSYQKETTMKASSRFMGKGTIQADFTFPYDTLKAYTAKGSLKKLPLETLNDMLTPAMHAKIESGVMNNLLFDLRYTMKEATGSIELNYENLRIIALQNNNPDKANIFKTFLLNTFIIKKDMDEHTKTDQKTGTVQHERDIHRSIFNYWTKSLLSGVKSAYKADRLSVEKPGFLKKSRKKKSEQANL